MMLTIDGEANEVWPGDTVRVAPGAEISLTVTVTDPKTPNAAGRAPELARLDIIVGNVEGPAISRTADVNRSTRVAARFAREDMLVNDENLTGRSDLTLRGDTYVRLRGTSTGELEPEPDPKGEGPWDDLWFYSNPIFIEVGGSEG